MQPDRQKFLGGSDIPSIFGLSPWKSAYDLFEEKTAVEWTEPEIEPARERMLRRGKKLEPWVIELLEEERGIFVQKRNQRYVDPECDFMACEIDFEYMDDCGLCNGDVKTVSPFAAHEWGEEGTDQIPLHYCLQFHWGLMITGRQKCLVGALIGADDLRVYEVTGDDQLISEIRQRASRFWNEHVLTGVPPALQTSSDAQKALAKYGGFACPGEAGVWEKIKRLRGVRAAQKRLAKVESNYQLEIKKYLATQAEALGLNDSPKKFEIHGPDGKAACSLTLHHRNAYTVAESDFFILRTHTGGEHGRNGKA